MAMKCDNCGKGIMIGHRVSHAKNRSRRIFKPNLHTAKLRIGATSRTMRLCTKCLRIFRENTKKPQIVKKEVSSIAPGASALA